MDGVVNLIAEWYTVHKRDYARRIPPDVLLHLDSPPRNPISRFRDSMSLWVVGSLSYYMDQVMSDPVRYRLIQEELRSYPAWTRFPADHDVMPLVHYNVRRGLGTAVQVTTEFCALAAGGAKQGWTIDPIACTQVLARGRLEDLAQVDHIIEDPEAYLCDAAPGLYLTRSEARGCPAVRMPVRKLRDPAITPVARAFAEEVQDLFQTYVVDWYAHLAPDEKRLVFWGDRALLEGEWKVSALPDLNREPSGVG